MDGVKWDHGNGNTPRSTMGGIEYGLSPANALGGISVPEGLTALGSEPEEPKLTIF